MLIFMYLRFVGFTMTLHTIHQLCSNTHYIQYIDCPYDLYVWSVLIGHVDV